MHRSYLPWLSKQNQQREEIASLKTQLITAQTELQKVIDALGERVRAHEALYGQHEQTLEETERLEAENTQLQTRVTTLEAELKAAKYHGKKKSTENVVAQS